MSTHQTKIRCPALEVAEDIQLRIRQIVAVIIIEFFNQIGKCGIIFRHIKFVRALDISGFV